MINLPTPKTAAKIVAGLGFYVCLACLVSVDWLSGLCVFSMFWCNNVLERR